jgi:vancomycin resistance protein YoaR
MATQPISKQAPQLAPPSFLAKAGAALLGSLIFFPLTLLAFSLGFNLMNAGNILPGVSVAGVNLSTLPRHEAIKLLESEINYPAEGKILLSYGESSWTFSPNELGLSLDAEASADAAYSFGRSIVPWTRIEQQFQSLRSGYDLAPRLIYNGQTAHAALLEIAQQINQDTIEAELSVEGLNVQVRPGQVGLELETENILNFLSAQLLRLQDAELSLPVAEFPPRIVDVSAQAAVANEILSQPLQILPGGNYPNNPEPWIFQPEQLATFLSIERLDNSDGADYIIGLDPQILGALLLGLAPELIEEPENAHFIFNDETRQLELIQAETIGRRLEVEASIEHINQELAQGAHSVELQYDYNLPAVLGDATASDLGISELVVEQISFFYGSSSARIQNIQTAAARFHGLLVAPGATFSMVENIGDISLDSGFAEALIIYGDRTIKGVGGGVCQVSTTLFRTAFFGGFPVVERNPHAYRVYYYELNQAGNINPLMVGLDATVYSPIVDFKFQNDSDYWLLMETYVDPGARTITWKFYSTSDGRTVEWDNTGVQNVVDAPETVYEENDELDKGEVKQVDWEAEGADVTVTRVVYQNGEVLFEDSFTTHYRPWAAVYQYGPKTPGYPPDPDKDAN